MPLLTYRGAIPELQGQKFDVPTSVPLTGASKWIESSWREEQAMATATAEKESREAEVLAARVEKARQDESISKLTTDLEGVTAQLEELNNRIVAEPDVSAQLQFNASAAGIYNRSLELADEVSAMQATVADLLTRATAMAEAAAVGEQLQQQALAMLTNNQQMMNGSFETYSAELQRLSDRTNFALIEVQELNTEATESRETLRIAQNITDEAVNIARQESTKAVAEMRDEFLDLMALSLRALGLRESDLTSTANAIAVAPNDSGTIRRSSVERFIEISRKANESIEKARGENLV